MVTASGKTIRVLTAGAILLCLAGVSSAAGWWRREWPFRRGVTIPETKPTHLDGDDVAVFTMPTGGHIKPDGGDIRVIASGGRLMPSRVLMTGPGDTVRIAFAIRSGVRKYHVYYGNPKAKPAKPLEIKRGVLLEMWKFRGRPPKNLKQAKKVFAAKGEKELLGRDFRDRIFLGHNPFGPDVSLASLYTAWFFAPQDGDYVFCSSSTNASFLLIDDKLVVNNGGAHRPQNTPVKRETIQLKAGLHKLTYMHVTNRGNPIAVAAWKPPGGKRIWPMAPGHFTSRIRASFAPAEQYGRGLSIDFTPTHASETFLGDRYTQRFIFAAGKVGKTGGQLQWQWDFGDGQKAVGEKVEHVYLVDGKYTVKLSAKTHRGVLTCTNTIVVSRPWDHVASRNIDSNKMHARIVAKYDFKKLSPAADANAVVLFDRVVMNDELLKAGNAFVLGDSGGDADINRVAGIYVRLLINSGKPGPAVEALLKSAKLARAPQISAGLLLKAGQVALEELGDTKQAMRIFTDVVENYHGRVNNRTIRLGFIGTGDVWRAEGDFIKASDSYEQAGRQFDTRAGGVEFHRGTFARYVEDFTRRREYAAAEKNLAMWAMVIPDDKLKGYWSLLKVRQLFAHGRNKPAAIEAEVLVRVNPRSDYAAELLLLAAKAYRKMGRREKTIEMLNKLAKNYPESPLSAEAASLLKKW